MKTVKVNLYTYAELSDKAKAKAREWWITGNDMSDELLEWFDNDLPNYGFASIDRDKISFSLSYCQGDGFSFTGPVYMDDLRKAYTEQNACDIQEMSEYVTLFDAEDRIKALGFAVDSMRIVRSSSHYAHEYIIGIECDYDWFANPDGRDVSIDPGEDVVDEASIAFEEALIELVSAVCVRFKDAGYKEIEYQESEEAIAENMAANEYLFTEDGVRASRILEDEAE